MVRLVSDDRSCSIMEKKAAVSAVLIHPRRSPVT